MLSRRTFLESNKLVREMRGPFSRNDFCNLPRPSSWLADALSLSALTEALASRWKEWLASAIRATTISKRRHFRVLGCRRWVGMSHVGGDWIMCFTEANEMSETLVVHSNKRNAAAGGVAVLVNSGGGSQTRVSYLSNARGFLA